MLVGRERELALLLSRIAEGKPLAVLGEAGVGKTTLVRAAAERTDRRLVEAGALATLSWLPYLPLRRAFGHEPERDPLAVAAAVETELGDALLFLDDLHWADAQTASLLPFLVDWVPLIAAVRRGDPGTSAALSAVAAAGLELLPLEPLAQDDATALARALHPDLTDVGAQRLVAASGGNPFLLEQLEPSGEASKSLRLAYAARLRALSADGWEAAAMLALLGRPAPRRLLGPGAGELVAAGLVTGDAELAMRHALLADAAVETLTEEQRAQIHARLAALLDDPGEAARHHAAAGERGHALEQALLAAEHAATPGERAAHLEVAASCADGERAEALGIEAAQALLDAGEASRSLAVLDRITLADDRLRAEAALVECAAAASVGDAERARTAWRRGAATPQPSPELALRLRLRDSELARALDDDAERSRFAADEAYELARRLGRHEARALCLRGESRLATGAPGWQDDLERAIDAALAGGENATVLEAGRSLVFGLLIDGRPAAGVEIAARLAEQARDLHMTGWEREFRYALAGFEWHAGSPLAAAEITAELAAEAGGHGGIDSWFYRCQALIELARYDEATAALAPARDRARLEHDVRHVLWAESDLAFWSGQPKVALRLAEECLAIPGLASEGPLLFARLTQCWAAVELDCDPGPAALAGRELYGMGAGMPIEEEALIRLAAGEHPAAAEAFGRGASEWRGRHARGELRCLWGRGEALRRAGEVGAVHALEQAEARALELQGFAVLARIRRSLRLAGSQRSAARTRDRTGLTGREREVLRLVAQGLTNATIARRLGVGRPTVVRVIVSAQEKLGATSRAQAAALAARG